LGGLCAVEQYFYGFKKEMLKDGGTTLNFTTQVSAYLGDLKLSAVSTTI
jgi:hypothetical protein